MSDKRSPPRAEDASARAIGGALLLVVGLLLVATGVVARTYLASGGREDPQPAAALRGRLEQAIAAAARALEPKAATAARLSEIVSGLDIDADPHTFEDLLHNEDWWAPYRAEFPVSGVITSSGALALLGPNEADISATPVVRQAREAGVASGTIALGGRPFMLAAARVPKGKRVDSKAVVVLGAALERPALQGIADSVGVATGLSDGKQLLAAAGPDGAHPTLAQLVGREDRAAGQGGVIRLDDGRSAVALPLDRGLWLLGLMPETPPPAGSQLGIFIAGAGALLGFAGLVLRLASRARGRAQAASDGVPAATRSTGSGPRRRSPSAELTAPKDPAAAAAIPASATGAAAAAVVEAAPTLERPPAGPGMTLGRYRLLERIGEGGMAEVFIAAAHGPEGFVRNFVVKRMHPHLARSRDAVNQFIDEGRLQSALVHSNIVPVFDFGRAGEEYFLALEYIHGRDLERLVRRHVEKFGRSLPAQVAFYILHEVLEALAYAHARTDQAGKSMGIVHRDISPGNILVSLSGEVKLSDFGIAKAEGRVSRTEAGLIKGNVSFMSPEQARGEVVDSRSDLFSAAVVLYYCLTAQFLYRDETMFNRLVRAAIGPDSAEFNQLGELPPVAGDVLRKALTLAADKRYQTAREFARDLAGRFTAGRTELADLMATLFPELKRESR